MRDFKLLLLVFVCLSLKQWAQVPSAAALAGSWQYLRMQPDNQNIKVLSSAGTYTYEFSADSTYKLHFQNRNQVSVSQGSWALMNRTLHLSENMPGTKDPGSLADAHHFRVLRLKDKLLVLHEGSQKYYFQRLP